MAFELVREDKGKGLEVQLRIIVPAEELDKKRALKIKEFKSERSGQQPLRESFLEIISFNPSLLRGKYYRTIQYHIE